MSTRDKRVTHENSQPQPPQRREIIELVTPSKGFLKTRENLTTYMSPSVLLMPPSVTLATPLPHCGAR